ncbi:MAG TPA: NfeD family protein [Agitococcus sp.]|nr:NfeD family protein [Agitococcus sp.]
MWQEPYWLWAAFACLLLIVEMLTGTFFFLAIAAAAFGTTAIAYFSQDYLTQWVVFAALSVIALVLWKKLRPTHQHSHDAASGLNNRTRHLIGRQAILSEPISNGVGRINVDDSWWKVTGEDLPVGTHVQVIAVHDMVLTVEKVQK